jgi:hypothetical protein
LAYVRWGTERGGGKRTIATSSTEQRNTMNLHLSLAPLISLLAGILILIIPRLLNYIIALYLIVVGVLGLIGDVHFH